MVALRVVPPVNSQNAGCYARKQPVSFSALDRPGTQPSFKMKGSIKCEASTSR